MTAEAKRVHHMATINGDAAVEMSRRDPPTLGDFIVGTYLSFKRRRWKLSTAVTTEDRIKRHIIKEIGDKPIKSLDRDALQELLDRKSGHSLRASSIISASTFGPFSNWLSKADSSTATPRGLFSPPGKLVESRVAL